MGERRLLRLLADVSGDFGGFEVGGGVVNGGFGNIGREGEPDGAVAGKVPKDADNEKDWHGQGEKEFESFRALQQVNGATDREAGEQGERWEQSDEIMRAIVEAHTDGCEGAEEQEEGEGEGGREGVEGWVEGG